MKYNLYVYTEYHHPERVRALRGHRSEFYEGSIARDLVLFARSDPVHIKNSSRIIPVAVAASLKASPLNINLGSDDFSMFNTKAGVPRSLNSHAFA